MRILVTGGCGFVGATICRRLVEHRAGAAVTAVDSLRRLGSELNRQTLVDLGVRVVHADVRLASDWDGLGSFDWVVDAAAEPSVLAAAPGSRGVTSRQLIEHNLLATVNLLEAAEAWGAGVVLLSTSRVYSIPALEALSLVERPGPDGAAFALDVDGPLPPGATAAGLTEEFSTASPVSPYGATKLASEILAAEHAHRRQTPVYINRCGVLAGAGQFGRADQGIFSWWIHSWAARRPLSYIGFGGRGLQVRDCLHPDDLAALVDRQIDVNIAGPNVCNVSGGAASATSLAELSQWCARRFGPHPVGTVAEARPYDARWLVLDSTRASRDFSWQPRRAAAVIFAEIADHAERHPDWLERCGG
jgi:CDP-paratose 2-epimerase